MANLNKELKKLFFAHLKRVAEEKSKSSTSSNVGYCGGMTPPVTHRPPYQVGLFNGAINNDYYMGCIYFYEWSDTNRTPKTYYTLKAFEKFLNDCHIFLASWQREVISHMKHPYIACKKGERDIIIRNSFTELSKAIEEGSKSTVPFTQNKGSEDKEPYNVIITRAPHMRHMETVFEPEGRWFG